MTERKIIALPKRQAAEEAAATWIVRLDKDDLSEADRAAFRQWYQASEQNKSAFDRLSSVWGGLDDLSDLTDLAASDDVASALKEDRRLSASRPFRRTMLIGSMAAAFMIVCALVMTSIVMPVRGDFQESYQTVIGQQRTVVLPDRSVVILNTDSAMEVAYSGAERLIKLTHGEAFFEVATDKVRPFSVETESGRVTAVGTAFSVRVHDEKIDVVVTHGRVALAPASIETAQDVVLSEAAGPSMMEVTAGQTVTFAQRVETLDQIATEDIERRLDWRDGMLAFRGEPLEQVVRDVSRYTDLIIEIDGEEIKQQPIGGYFKVGETEALFEALTTLSDLEVERVDEGRIRIARAD